MLDTLRGYAFPGNVRELENILERALAFANDGVIEVGDLALKASHVTELPPGYVPAPAAVGSSGPGAFSASGAAAGLGAMPGTGGGAGVSGYMALPGVPGHRVAGPAGSGGQPAWPVQPGRQGRPDHPVQSSRTDPHGQPLPPETSEHVVPAGPAVLPLPPLDALPSNLPDYLAQVERDIIMRALAQTQYNRTQAASLLGISFRQLRYQMQKLNIQEPDA